MTSALARNGNGVGGKCEQKETVRTQEGTTLSKAIRIEDANLVARTNVAASRQLFTNEDAAKSFQSRVIEFSAADLARAAHRTKNAAKGWKDGSRAPDISSTITMARSIPAVQQWLAEESGYRDAQAMSADAVIRWAREYRNASGMDGDVARAVLAAVVGSEQWTERTPKGRRK